MFNKKINLKGLTEQQINNLKKMSKQCVQNEPTFRNIIAINLVGRLQQRAMQTDFSNKALVLDFETVATKEIRMWFPYMSADEALIEAKNIRSKNTININSIVKDMKVLYKQFN